MENWKTVEREEVWRSGDGRYLRVEHHQVALPGGEVIEAWPWIHTPDYVNIVAQTPEGQILCFRQTKYAVEGTTLAVPGGYIEADEDPLVAAQRELLEETGYTASEWQALGSYAVDGNRGSGTAYFFLARQARRVQAADADDLEEQAFCLLTIDEVRTALLQGEFKVLPWMSIVALALVKLGE